MKAVFAALSAGMILTAAAPAFAGVQDFTIVNKTGMTLKEVYVEADSNEEDWGESLIEEALKSGESVEIGFSGYGDECKFSILLVDNKGTEYTVEGVDLCEISNVTFTKKGKDVLWQAKYAQRFGAGLA